MITLCIKCRYHIILDKTRASIWYNNVCKKAERPKAIDPVTGIEQYTDHNDLGTKYFTDQQHKHCRDINNGNCCNYEPKTSQKKDNVVKLQK